MNKYMGVGFNRVLLDTEDETALTVGCRWKYLHHNGSNCSILLQTWDRAEETAAEPLCSSSSSEHAYLGS